MIKSLGVVAVLLLVTFCGEAAPLVGGTRAKAKTHVRARRSTAHHRAVAKRAFAARGKKHEKGLRKLQGGWTFEESEYRREDFAKLRGKMPWPVESREVSMHFGYQRYVEGKPIYVNNHGITIEAGAGADVKSASIGEVSAVMEIGDVNAVVVKHGHYYVTYSNLTTVNVAKGDTVQLGQCLGQLGDEGQLEFLISDQSDHLLDPEKWLRRD